MDGRGIEVILACSCSGMDKKAQTSFSILFPDKPAPMVIKGADQVRKLASEYPDTNLERYLRAVAMQKGRWAYYLATDELYNITELYDLITGRRVG